MRLILALLLAPLATPLVFAITELVLRPGQDGLYSGAVVATFASVFAYAAAILFGLPLYAMLRLQMMPMPWAALIGGVIGFGVWQVYVTVIEPDQLGASAVALYAASIIGSALSATILRGVVRGSAA